MTLEVQIVEVDHCLHGDTYKLTLQVGETVQAFYQDARPYATTYGKWFLEHPFSPRARLVPDAFSRELDKLLRTVFISERG